MGFRVYGLGFIGFGVGGLGLLTFGPGMTLETIILGYIGTLKPYALTGYLGTTIRI